MTGDEPATIDPALAGRDLGPWFMVPWWASIPLAIALGVVLVWYFVRLGRPEVPRGRRWLRRISVVLAIAGLAPLVRALTFAHPHEDRLAFAVAWSTVLFVIVACLLLAVIDVILVTRGGMQEYRELRRTTLGGRRGGSGDG